jgi:hypothetical protein
MDINRLEFDSTVDEIVDVQLRLAQKTAAFKRQRRNSIWFVAVFSAVAPPVIFFWRVTDGQAVAVAAVVGLILGPLAGYLYGRFYDYYVKKHSRRMVVEMLGASQNTRCEYELRPDALWSRFRDMELTLPWSRLTRIEDGPGAISLWFDPGLAVIQDRAFRNADDRRQFLETVRARLPGTATRE